MENQSIEVTNQPGPALAPAKDKLFNASAEFNFRIPSGTWKRCKVRYPSDQEWCERARKSTIVRKSLGRGKSMPIPQRTEITDANLFSLIRLDSPETGGDVFDDADASEVISQLDFCRVDDARHDADAYVLTLSCLNSTTTHTMRMPSRAQSLEHERNSVFRMDDNRMQILRMAIEPSGQLYDKLVVSTTGYAEGSAVPINHKYAVVYELLNTIENEIAAGSLDEALPEH